MGEPFVKIDLHGLRQEEAMRMIDRAIASAGLVWDTADMAQGLMVVTNIPSIAILGGVAIKCLNDYTKQKKEGKAPVFKAENIGIEDKVDCWK